MWMGSINWDSVSPKHPEGKMEFRRVEFRRVEWISNREVNPSVATVKKKSPAIPAPDPDPERGFMQKTRRPCFQSHRAEQGTEGRKPRQQLEKRYKEEP
jgi:hypothetical protein